MANYDFTRTLAADQEITLDCAASNRFQVMSADAVFYVKPEGQERIRAELGVGQKIRKTFDKLWIKNGSTPQTIEIKVSDDEIIDNRMVGTVDISGGIVLAGSDTAGFGNATVGTSAAVLLAESAVRGSALIQNLGAYPIYIGTDDTVTTANGIKIDGNGGSLTLALKTDVYAITGTAGQDVRYIYGEV